MSAPPYPVPTQLHPRSATNRRDGSRERKKTHKANGHRGTAGLPAPQDRPHPGGDSGSNRGGAGAAGQHGPAGAADARPWCPAVWFSAHVEEPPLPPPPPRIPRLSRLLLHYPHEGGCSPSGLPYCGALMGRGGAPWSQVARTRFLSLPTSCHDQVNNLAARVDTKGQDSDPIVLPTFVSRQTWSVDNRVLYVRNAAGKLGPIGM